MQGPDKSFWRAVSLSAAAHAAAATLALFSLAPVPAVLLPYDGREIISVSLVAFSSGSRTTDDSGVSRPLALKPLRSGHIRQTGEEYTAAEEAKHDLMEKQTRTSDAGLDVYTDEHPHAGKVPGNPEKAREQNPGAANNAVNVNGSTEGLRTPLLIPAYRNNNPPRYPMAARLRGYEGLVLVATEVLADGTVGKVKLKKSSGYRDLDDSAVEAVRKWLFQPGQRMGIAITMWVDVPIRFALKE